MRSVPRTPNDPDDHSETPAAEPSQAERPGGTPASVTPTPVAQPHATPVMPVAAPSSTSVEPRGSLVADRRLSWTWQAIGAIAVLVGLLTGIVTLLDRFTAGPPPVVTPAPTRPAISVDVSSAAGARGLIAFLDEHGDGETVELDIACYESVARPACLLEQSPVDVPGGSTTYDLLWLFGGDPCFAPEDVLPQASGTGPDILSCTETSVMWIDPRTGDAPVVFGNIQGAGTIALKGTWVLRSPMGAAFLPPSIHGYRVTPFGIASPVDGAPASVPPT